MTPPSPVFASEQKNEVHRRQALQNNSWLQPPPASLANCSESAAESVSRDAQGPLEITVLGLAACLAWLALAAFGAVADTKWQPDDFSSRLACSPSASLPSARRRRPLGCFACCRALVFTALPSSSGASFLLKLKLEGQVAVATARCLVQLSLLGYLLARALPPARAW